MARIYYSAAAAGRNTSTTTSWSDQVSLTFTGTANKKYLMLWGCSLDNTSTIADSRARLFHDTASAQFNIFNFEAIDTTDNCQIAAAWIYTASASPTSQTFSVEYSHESSGQTAGCQDGYLIALELHNNDLTSFLAAEQTRTNAAFGDIGTSVTCSTGNWLLITSSETKNSVNNAANNWEIHDGTNQIVVTGPDPVKDTTNYHPLWQVVRVSPGSSTVYKMRFKSDGAATVNARNTTLVALDLSQFADVVYGESLGESTTTNTSATTKLSVTDTPYALPYLQIFGAANRNTNSTSISSYVDYTRGGSPISVEAERESLATDTFFNHGYGAVSTLAASSTTWEVRYRSENASNTAGVKNAVFAGLALGDAPNTVTITASLNAAIQKTQTAAASLNAAIQKSQTTTANLSAVLQKTLLQTASLDAVISDSTVATAAMDAAVQANRAVTAQLSAAIQIARSENASLDAVIQAARTAAASLDAYIVTAEVVVEVISSGGGSGGKRRKDFTDWWVEWSKARKMRRDKKLAAEVEQYREQVNARTLAALDAEEVERVARLEAELRAIEYGRREIATKQAIDTLMKQIAIVREMLWQAELDADDEDVLLLLT